MHLLGAKECREEEREERDVSMHLLCQDAPAAGPPQRLDQGVPSTPPAHTSRLPGPSPPFSPPSGGPVTHSVAAQLQLRPPSSTLPASVSCVQHVLGVTCRPTAFAAGILPAKEMTIAELKRWSNLSNLPARHLFGAQFTGQPVLIGGTMGTCSYVLTGTEKVKTF